MKQALCPHRAIQEIIPLRANADGQHKRSTTVYTGTTGTNTVAAFNSNSTILQLNGSTALTDHGSTIQQSYKHH